MTIATAGAKKRHALDAYLKPKTLVMLALGFSSGLPFLLVGNTFGYWLRDEGTALTAIGFLSWVGIAYSLKFLWAPVIDRTLAPVAGKLGRRRGWMLLAQLFVCLALIAMGIAGTSHGLALLGVLALVVAFSSSTQDIVIDAWRIEIADDADELGLLSSAYQLGYRAALLATDALILIAAQHLSWPVSYVLYGLLMIVGIVATFFAREPKSADVAMNTKEAL
jgi:PAT family beta-lactamase induction signal transducer AmpG